MIKIINKHHQKQRIIQNILFQTMSSQQKRTITKLTDSERSSALTQVPEWKYNTDKEGIEKQFKFKNFAQAWTFMSHVAYHAEVANHHPEWFNVYNRVDVLLRTHDANGLSTKDIDLAKKMDAYEKFLQDSHKQ
jgi:4a-hydroxytetrahydrobiopterin dehydratase